MGKYVIRTQSQTHASAHQSSAPKDLRTQFQKVFGGDGTILHEQVNHHVPFAGFEQDCHESFSVYFGVSPQSTTRLSAANDQLDFPAALPLLDKSAASVILQENLMKHSDRYN
eukprot:451572-Pelagomonas_calceolata.AAC.3